VLTPESDRSLHKSSILAEAAGARTPVAEAFDWVGSFCSMSDVVAAADGGFLSSDKVEGVSDLMSDDFSFDDSVVNAAGELSSLNSGTTDDSLSSSTRLIGGSVAFTFDASTWSAVESVVNFSMVT